MDIRPDLIPSLQAKLAELDKRQAARDALTPRLQQAQGAVTQLEGQMAELGRQGIEHAARAAHADPDRLTQMLTGATVAPIDKVAEARQTKFRSLDAQRVQIRRDLEVVTRHLGGVRADADAADKAVAAAYADFLDSLWEAVAEAYQRTAHDFVSRFVPAFYSIGYRRRQATGMDVPFGLRIVGGLQVQWAEPEQITDWPGATPRPKMTLLWPRGDMKLLSGEPVESDAVIDALMEDVRKTKAPQAKPAAA